MATETGEDVRTDSGASHWVGGVVGGLVGALVMGGLMIAMNEDVLAVAIPSLYTLAPPPSVPTGVAVHVFHGAVLGLVFAGLVTVFRMDSPIPTVGLGIGWGVVTWVGLAALLMPVWLDSVGSPADPPFPNFAPPSLLWHVTYGLVLGGVYVAIDRWI